MQLFRWHCHCRASEKLHRLFWGHKQHRGTQAHSPHAVQQWRADYRASRLPYPRVPLKSSLLFIFQNYIWYTGVHLKKKKKVRWSWYLGVGNPWLHMTIPNKEGSAGQQHWPWAHLCNWATSRQQEHQLGGGVGRRALLPRKELKKASWKESRKANISSEGFGKAGWGVWSEVRQNSQVSKMHTRVRANLWLNWRVCWGIPWSSGEEPCPQHRGNVWNSYFIHAQISPFLLMERTHWQNYP